MSPTHDGAELRGWAARQMTAEDARWAMDLVLSNGRLPDLGAHIALTLGHHFVRIAHEGTEMLRSPDPRVGVPELAALLDDTYASITQRGRQVTKLLDDDKKSYDAVLGELDQVITEHRASFTGNAVWWARRFETDLGLYVAKRRVLGASWLAAYRLGLRIEPNGTILGHDLMAVTKEWGGTLAVLGAAALDGAEPTATLDPSAIPTIAGKDKRSRSYLARRFDGEFTDALKMLLLAIEGEMNTLIMVAPHSEAGHEPAVFRARTISLYHSLTALTTIAKRYDHMTSEGMSALNALLADSAVQALLSPPGKMVRNRCMHYEIKDPRIIIDPSLPMFGIVESVFPTESLASFSVKVTQAIGQVATLLGNWAPQQR